MTTYESNKMRLCFFILSFYFVSDVCSQNLVPNANFQEYTVCPIGISHFTTLNWTSPFWPGTPDYFNICNNNDVGIPFNELGNQESQTGDAYVGIYTYGLNTREFIQAILTSPTVAGATYELTMIYSPADNFGHSDGLGMLLSVGSPTSYMGQIPQMVKSTVVENQTDWHTITYEYLSPGGETHLTIGNFNTDNNSSYVPEGMYQDNAYYYIDSITVKCIGAFSSDILPDLGDNVELCKEDFPYTIMSNLPNAYNEWSTGETGASIEIDSPGQYFVKSSINCQYGMDTIVISTFEEPILFVDNKYCAEDNYLLQLDSDLGNFVWNDGSLGSELLVTESGDYTVTLTYSCGVVKDSVQVSIGNDLDQLDIENKYILCEGQQLPVDFGGLYLDSVLWNDGSISEDRLLSEAGLYSAKLTSFCTDTTLYFELQQEECFYIPNAFSPNNDQVNDYFAIGYAENWDASSFRLAIYDRWGEEVFYSEEPDFKWYGDYKGKSLNSDVFVYFYELEIEVNGLIQLHVGSGDITLLK